MEFQDISFEDKKVLIRVDFNVPLDADRAISDDTRIQMAVPTLRHILDHGGSPIIMSHLGRPLKDKNNDGSIKRDYYSLRHVKDHLSSLLDTTVNFIDDTIGNVVREAALALPKGEILLLENTRFYEEEKKGDKAFAKQLAALSDIYINDAFGTAHRAHASTSIVAEEFAHADKSFGFLMQKELRAAKKALHAEKSGFVAIIGGAKVSDKIQLISEMMDKVESILIGGGMAYTFIKAMGGNIGNSLCEDDKIKLAKEILAKAKKQRVNIILPKDSLCADKFAADANCVEAPSMQIPDGYMALDIGSTAIQDAEALLSNAKTIIWNGPMGVFEFEAFAKGTLAVAQAVAQATKNGAYSLIGGGDSVSAVNKSGLADEVSFISTGGGAMLTLLEGKKLPGVEAILR